MRGRGRWNRDGWPRTGPGRYVRATMQRRMFVWFGLSILVTMLAVGVVMITLGGASFQPWKRDMSRIQTFVGGRFASVWDDPARRDELARAMQRDLDLNVVLLDEKGTQLATYGGTCDPGRLDAPVIRNGARIGEVLTCPRAHSTFGWRLLAGILTACAVLWAISGKIARRLTRPLDELVRVANDLGAGDFSARVRVRHTYGEIGVLSCVINEMAGRIEKQINDQRELLAAVSHEIRTPLTRIRLLMEMARDNGADEKTITEVEREVVEIDRLVSELLASSRMQFSAMTISKLDAAEAAARALERAGKKDKLVVDAPDGTSFDADATLIARALANLIDNADHHGGGLTRMRVVSSKERVRFEAEDDGPGFAPGDERRVFDPFVQSPSSSSRNGNDAERGSLGLGLALVKRIADAHEGEVEARNRDGGGAIVAIELPRRGRVASTPRTRSNADVEAGA